VYFPVFGLTRKTWLGLYASMLVMGLWHAVDLNWTFWGLWHGTGLVVVARWERWKKARRKRRKKAGLPPAASYERFTKWLGYPVTFLYVALGYAFVSTGSFEQGLKIVYYVFRLPLARTHGELLLAAAVALALVLVVMAVRPWRAQSPRRDP
jgi:D-alanyl-lipoteichoic acid acyltransferase DltB (MBOAT superfamily)